MQVINKGAVCTALFVVAAVSLIVWFLLANEQRHAAKREIRQQEINAFYYKHKCRPIGYVAGRYEPIRIYQCDNGVFIAADMK